MALKHSVGKRPPQRFSIRYKGGPLTEDECAVVRESIQSSTLIVGCNVRFNQRPDVSKVSILEKGIWDASVAPLLVRYAFNLLGREFDVEVDKPSVYKKVEEPYGVYSRPWKVWTPEAMMELQFPTHKEAMVWALLSPQDREMIIEEDFRQEGGW